MESEILWQDLPWQPLAVQLHAKSSQIFPFCINIRKIKFFYINTVYYIQRSSQREISKCTTVLFSNSFPFFALPLRQRAIDKLLQKARPTNELVQESKIHQSDPTALKNCQTVVFLTSGMYISKESPICFECAFMYREIGCASALLK